MEGSKEKKPRRTLKGLFQKNLRPETFEKRYTLKEKSATIDAAVASDEAVPSAEAELLKSLHTRCILVKAICGTGLRAADSNNLSDPYVVIRLGDHVCTSRVEPKTLNPRWEETFVFSAEDAAHAIEQGKPWIDFQVYDKDLLSSDDFLGQATVDLADLDLASTSLFSSNHTLPLSGVGRFGRKEQHGEICVAVWFSAEGAGAGGDVAGALTLMPQPGFTGAPQIVQARGSWLYEEPLFVCLSVKVNAVVNALGDGTSGPHDGSSQASLDRSPGSAASESSWSDERNDLDLLDPWGEDDGSEVPLLPVSNDDASDDVASGTSGSHASSKDTYLYCRVALGSQARLTRVVKVRNGAAKWRSGLLAFAVPVPMRDRAVRMEVWQTTSSGKKGRAAFVAQPHLFTILPDVGGIAPDLHQRRTLEVPLVAMNGTKTAAALSITVAVADLDSRRALYLQELLEHREIEEMQAGQSGAVARLQSTTRELTAREMKLLGKLTAEKFAEHEASRQRRAQAAATLVDAAHYGARKMAHFASRVQARLGGRIAEEEESLAQLDPLSSLREALPAIAPLACLRLKLNSVKIIRAAAGPVATGFCIFRCGANWGKTPPVKVISGAMDFETWTVEIPVFDPATVLVVGVFEKMGLHRSRGLAVQMVGKLRVRLSTLQPDQDISAELPLLSERKKGAHRVGVASMGLLLKFTSANARLASLVAPPLPKEVFVHSLDTAPVQKLMNAARRRMVAQWLSPTIPRDLMMAMEDTEREEFAMSRLKANARRIRLALFVLRRGALAFRAVQSWERPYMSGAVCAVAVTAVYVPWLVYGLGLLAAAAACHASIPANVGFPEGMEHDPPEVDSDDEETGSRLDLNANSVNPYTQLKRKLERLQGITLTVQNVMDDIATTLERLIALATWQDPLATMILVWTLGIIGTALLLLGVKPLLAGLALFVLRPPQLRTPWTPPPVALFARLPSRADRTV